MRTTTSDENRIVPELNGIQPGQKVVYHSGPDLSTCHPLVQNTALKLSDQGRVHLFQKRTSPPMRGDRVDRQFGIGAFDYLAVGRRQ